MLVKELVALLIQRDPNSETPCYCADGERYRWLCDGHGYLLEEQGLCGHSNEKEAADKEVDECMEYERTLRLLKCNHCGFQNPSGSGDLCARCGKKVDSVVADNDADSEAQGASESEFEISNFNPDAMLALVGDLALVATGQKRGTFSYVAGGIVLSRERGCVRLHGDITWKEAQ